MNGASSTAKGNDARNISPGHVSATRVCPGCRVTRSARQFVGVATMCRKCVLRAPKQ